MLAPLQQNAVICYTTDTMNSHWIEHHTTDELHLPYTVNTADAVFVPISLVAIQTYSAASTGCDWRMVRLLCTVLESRFLSEMVTLIPSEDSCVRLLLDSRLHHVITGVLTPSASQVNTAGLGDTTVVFMGGTVMVAGTAWSWKEGADTKSCGSLLLVTCKISNDYQLLININFDEVA